jgi:hypothetical protein
VGACRGKEVGYHNAGRVGGWGSRCTFLVVISFSINRKGKGFAPVSKKKKFPPINDFGT